MVKKNTDLQTPAGRAAAFLFGMAHAFDLGGSLAPARGRFLAGPAADARALRGDWERAVGRAADEPATPGR